MLIANYLLFLHFQDSERVGRNNIGPTTKLQVSLIHITMTTKSELWP